MLVFVYKSGKKSDASNYRPISIISMLAKIFESIVCSKLSEFLFPKIGTHQHGFIRGQSVLNNLFLYNDFLFEAFKVSLQVDSIYVDLSKAFDTANHGLLRQKIWNAGITSFLFRWLKSFLTNRTQRVRPCGGTSYEFPSPCEVPQGSNIGPILLCSVCESQN